MWKKCSNGQFRIFSDIYGSLFGKSWRFPWSPGVAGETDTFAQLPALGFYIKLRLNKIWCGPKYAKIPRQWRINQKIAKSRRFLGLKWSQISSILTHGQIASILTQMVNSSWWTSIVRICVRRSSDRHCDCGSILQQPMKPCLWWENPSNRCWRQFPFWVSDLKPNCVKLCRFRCSYCSGSCWWRFPVNHSCSVRLWLWERWESWDVALNPGFASVFPSGDPFVAQLSGLVRAACDFKGNPGIREGLDFADHRISMTMMMMMMAMAMAMMVVLTQIISYHICSRCSMFNSQSAKCSFRAWPAITNMQDHLIAKHWCKISPCS